jgi:plastocyanin
MMNIRHVAVSALSIGGLVMLLNACGPTTPVTPPAPPPPAGTACPTAPESVTAGIGGNVYAPASCTVKVGTSVNIQASGFHPLASVSNNWPAPILGATTAQTVTFTAAGTYTYKCTNHGASGTSGMIGTITVTN